MKNLTIEGTISYEGSIAQYNYGDIVNCTIKAVVDSAVSSVVGGITRNNESGGEIIGCVVTGNVSGGVAGGIAGNNDGVITACAVTGDVKASELSSEGYGNAGGIVGKNDDRITTVAACYYSGTVTPKEGVSETEAGTRVEGEITWEKAIEEMNAQLGGCEYEFALDETTKKPKLVKKGSPEQAVSRLLGHFWG